MLSFRFTSPSPSPSPAIHPHTLEWDRIKGNARVAAEAGKEGCAAVSQAAVDFFTSCFCNGAGSAALSDGQSRRQRGCGGGGVRLANEGKLRLRMLLAIYEKSQINQTNNENTPTKRRLGKKETSKGGRRVKCQQEGSRAEKGGEGRVAKLMQSFLNEKIYDGNTQN